MPADRRSLVKQFQPNEQDEIVLEELKDKAPESVRRETIVERTGLGSSKVAMAFDRLLTAGWIERKEHGAYRFVADYRTQKKSPEPKGEERPGAVKVPYEQMFPGSEQ